MLPLPGHDQLGRKVLFGRWGIYDPKMVSMDELIKTTSMFIDVMLDEDELSSITGIVMLGDCTGLTVSHAVAFTPSHAKKSLVMWQVCVLPMGRVGEERRGMPAVLGLYHKCIGTLITTPFQGLRKDKRFSSVIFRFHVIEILCLGSHSVKIPATSTRGFRGAEIPVCLRIFLAHNATR